MRSLVWCVGLTIGLSGVCLLLTIRQPAVAQPAADAPDYYIADGQRVKLTILRDRIGIVTKAAVPPNVVSQIVDDAQWRMDQPLPGGIMVLRADNAREPVELERMVRSISARNAARGDNAAIKHVGLLVLTEGAQTPMLLTEEFVVEFKDNVTPQFIADLNARYKVQVVRGNPFRKNQFFLRSTAESNLSFLAAPIRYYETEQAKLAHPNFVRPKVLRQVVPNDPMFGQQWHHDNTGQSGGTPDADIDSTLAWEISRGNDNLIIAVIDNGFDVAHPDLIPNLWTNPGEIPGDGIDNDGNTLVDDVNGWDFSDGDGNLSGGAHGTNVAGCVGARGDNAVGVSGTCQLCRLMLIKSGITDADDALSFDYARVLGAQVITNSWGYAIGPATPAVIQSINDAATMGRGGLGSVVLFAMNNPNLNDCGANPDISSIENVIAVSRATNRDRFDNSGFGNCMDVLGPTRSQNGFGTLGIVTTQPGGGYTNNFGGTSAATPITAGIVGLMLDVSPNLTRLQMQRVLQDTTDKTEDSLGAYTAIAGFSAPATGHSTHGYGRVNAFEAVRLVAPVDRQGRGGVDVMLRDNRLDWGNTEQPSNTLFEPTRGFIPHWQSVDVKVDAPPLQSAPTTSQEFDAFADEDPRATQTNRVYVRVRNRGPHRADSVTVKLHWSFAGTALPGLPADFWTAFPADSMDTSIWHPIASQTINNLDYCGASVAGQVGSDVAQIVGFDFNAPALDPSQPAFQHYCVFCVIDSPQDRVSGLARSSLIADFVTPRDNNVTHRNLVLQPPTREGRSLVRFFIRNPSDRPLKSKLEVIAPKGWTTSLDHAETGQPFELKGREERPLVLQVTPPEPNVVGEIVVLQYDLNGPKPAVNGGLTVQVNRPISPGKQ